MGVCGKIPSYKLDFTEPVEVPGSKRFRVRSGVQEMSSFSPSCVPVKLHIRTSDLPLRAHLSPYL